MAALYALHDPGRHAFLTSAQPKWIRATVKNLAIKATVQAHGAGKIAPDEMPISNPKMLRFAPSYSVGGKTPAPGESHPYTVDALAKFLGLVKQKSQEPKDSFHAAFGAIELIEEGTSAFDFCLPTPFTRSFLLSELQKAHVR